MDGPGTDVSGRLVGRSRVVDTLRGATRADGPRVVVLRGEAGVGKTAVIRELEATCEDVLFLTGGCFRQVSGDLPFSPLVQALRPLRRGRGPMELSVEEANVLAPLLGGGADWDERARWTQVRLYEAF